MYHIIIVAVPSEPCSFKVVYITTSSVKLQWMPPETTNGVITQYSMQYSDTVINNFGNKVNTSDMWTGTIEGLSPDTEYELKLRAHTSVTDGLPASLTVKTSKLLQWALCISAKPFKFSTYVIYDSHTYPRGLRKWEI